MKEQAVIERIEQDLKLMNSLCRKSKSEDLDKKWRFLVSAEPKRFINDDLSLKADALRNFRRETIFIPDAPTYNPSLYNPKNILSGVRRGDIKLLKEYYAVIAERGYDYLLKKYPISSVGNPHCFSYKGAVFNQRWLKHISYLGLFRKHNLEELPDDFTALDIGSSYGIFSNLLKKEFPQSHCLLLDFPEQLVLARYFLEMNFAGVKIAGFKELSDMDKIDRNTINEYDFILVPYFYYNKLAPGSIDLITNFASLGEMNRNWFDYYLKAEPFLSVKYCFMVNRIQSYPTYDNDLTIMDYPLNDFKKIHFGVWPIPPYIYKKVLMFFSEKDLFSSQYFEFIGERIN